MVVPAARYRRQPTEQQRSDGDGMAWRWEKGEGERAPQGLRRKPCVADPDQQWSHEAPTVFLLFISGWISRLKRSAPDTAPVSGPSR